MRGIGHFSGFSGQKVVEKPIKTGDLSLKSQKTQENCGKAEDLR